jgi:signal peptidase I
VPRSTTAIFSGQRFRFTWIGLAGVIFAGLVGVALGRAFFGTVAIVDGSSMYPTFRSGATIHTMAIISPIERGDIVLLDDGRQEYALKRIVGLPGEIVHIWRGRIFINRRMLQELYLPKHTYTAPSDQNRQFVFELGEDEYLVLGDNRDCSEDSRTYGPVRRAKIKSRVPQAETSLRAEFAPYTLPAPGKTAIRAL